LASAADLLQKMRSPTSEFDHAFLFRPSPTSWQKNYGELCLGNKTKFTHLPQDASHAVDFPLCFEKAIVPGAALYLADGLVSSVLFRELAAEMKGIRVPVLERNLITIFRRSGNRRILNLSALTETVQNKSRGLKVAVVNWDANTDFKTQALQMARTRILIATHGSVMNHNAFMESGGVVIEIDAYQFIYPAGGQIVLFRGNHYIRYEESLENSKPQNFPLGHDPFPGKSTQQCMRDMACLLSRRDADVQIDLRKFAVILQQAVSLVT
jgi:hypothetical protein